MLTAERTSNAEFSDRADPHRMDEVLATLGHEMRNPLSALSYALEVWPGCETDSAQMGEIRNLIQRQVSQLSRLSDELRDAASLTRGKLQLRQEHVALERLIDGACEQIRPIIDRRGQTMTVELPSESTVVNVDPSRLIQVFANLIQNAAKFTDHNGSLRVTAEAQDGSVLVRIRDNGRGIEGDLLPAIFDTFTQGVAPAGIANDGLGIGLGLVKSIVELHGGSVTAYSAGLGHGSEFTVWLPRVQDGAYEGAQDGHRLPAFRIVVADDDRSNRELLARLLRMNGQSVSVASGGAMAVRMVSEERPQVVVLDLMMGDMDGFEVARRLRGDPELAGLVLIALSGSADDASRDRASEAGFDAHLVKPASFATLAETLARIPSFRRAGSDDRRKKAETVSARQTGSGEKNRS